MIYLLSFSEGSDNLRLIHSIGMGRISQCWGYVIEDEGGGCRGKGGQCKQDKTAKDMFLVTCFL